MSVPLVVWQYADRLAERRVLSHILFLESAIIARAPPFSKVPAQHYGRHKLRLELRLRLA
jgi:hypothetical protein